MIILFAIIIVLLVLSLILFFRHYYKLFLALLISAIIMIIVVIVFSFKDKDKVEQESSTDASEETEEEIQYIYDLTLPNTMGTEYSDSKEILNITLPVWKQYTEEHNLPLPTYVDKVWNDVDGTHAYLQSINGDQTYEVCFNDETVSLNFYGSSFHKGCKGIAYGSCIMTGVNVAEIESKLISMGYGDLLFTVTEVTDDSITLVSETGFTQRFDR